MSDSASSVPMSSAADVWRRLVNDGVLLPQSYDEDLVTLLEGQLPGSGTLLVRMEVAGWTARDLLRAMAPVVDSFAGLMRDLLSLYTDIAASQATKENLTVSYEFDEGDVFDQSLAQFRSAVATLDRAQVVRGSFVLSPQRWDYSSDLNWSHGHGEAHALRDEGEDGWDFTLPPPPETDNPAVARGVSLVYAMLTAACDTLRNYGATMRAVSNTLKPWQRSKNAPTEHKTLFSDFTDYFPEGVILKLRADVEYLAYRPPSDVDSWLRKVENWCSSFWETEPYESESALDSVLSLPMWGKRHELYSAWVVCAIAEAFKGQHLQFEVVEGTLSFPFKATKIATFEDRVGRVELWAEVRSSTSGEMSHGRKRGVQPDYRFLRPGQERSETDMAVEVKHYRRAAATRHGETAKDYAKALPRAQMTIVAHGPIGRTAIGRVAASDRPRVSFRENVRSLVSAETKAFVAELAEVFPPALHVQFIEVVRSGVDDVVVRLVGARQEPGGGTVLPRGTRMQPLGPSTEVDVVVEIVCHPERRHTIDAASLRVALTFSDGVVRYFEAAQPNLSTSWHVGTLRARSFTMSAAAVESAG
jgi:hypothetical protein